MSVHIFGSYDIIIRSERAILIALKDYRSEVTQSTVVIIVNIYRNEFPHFEKLKRMGGNWWYNNYNLKKITESYPVTAWSTNS